MYFCKHVYKAYNREKRHHYQIEYSSCLKCGHKKPIVYMGNVQLTIPELSKFIN